MIEKGAHAIIAMVAGIHEITGPNYEITTLVRDVTGEVGQISFGINVRPARIRTKIIIVASTVQALTTLARRLKEGGTVWSRGLRA